MKQCIDCQWFRWTNQITDYGQCRKPTTWKIIHGSDSACPAFVEKPESEAADGRE